jgi:hypothetical protein
MKNKIIFLIMLCGMSFSCINKSDDKKTSDDNVKINNIQEEMVINNNKNKLMSFMVYGNDFIATIALPNKWKVDMSLVNQLGVNGYFYLKEYSSNDSPVAVFLNLAYKPNDETKLEEWIEYDINGFLEYYDDFISEKLDWKIISEKGNEINIYSLKNNKTKYQQYSAYFDVGLNYFVNIYISIIDEKFHDEIIDDFKRCLENSEFTGIGVIME